MSKRVEREIEKIVAAHAGDVHGALRALMIVNEHLETELQSMYAIIGGDGRAGESLH